MSLKNNIISNYISQIYVALISILITPIYINHMGTEAYGLIGFYAILQVCFNLLDMGLTPTISRETARFHGGAMSGNDYLRLVRALEGIFIGISIIGGLSLFVCAKSIAQEWLKITNLPIEEVTDALQMVAAIIALRWYSGLYRGIISGAQQLIWLSTFNSIIATLRFIAVIPIIIYFDNKIISFFGFQLTVAILELGSLSFKAYKILPKNLPENKIKWEWQPLRPILKFSLSIAVTSVVWILITQLDKLILSKILLLEEYGEFSLAVLLASGVLLFSSPISSAITPYMAKLEAEKKHQEQLIIYRKATQFVTILAGSAAISIALYSKEILWTWTGNLIIAENVAIVLSYYVLGNGLLVISAFPSYLQYAKGNMHLHLIGNVAFAIIFIPLIMYAASRYGTTGAGLTWLIMNFISFFAWIPFVHIKFAPGINRKWYAIDTIPIIIAIFTMGYILKKFLPTADNRIEQLVTILGVSIIMVITGVIAASFTRDLLIKKLGH